MNTFLLLASSIALFSIPFLNFDLFPLSWVFLVPIMYLIENNKLSPFKLGVAFGTSSLLIITYWTPATIVSLTGASWEISIITHLIYCIYESLFYVLIFSLISISIKKIDSMWVKYLFIVFLYIIVEQNFPRIFPYKLGNSQIVFTEISQLISIFGINIISILILLINISLYELLLKKNKKIGYFALAILITAFCSGVIIEKNLKHYEKKKTGIDIVIIQPVDSLERLVEIQERASKNLPKADLTIWPESALDKIILENDGDYNKFQKIFSKKFLFNSKSLLFGSIVKKREGFYNGAILINEESQITDLYFKNKLMIFGEYYPLKNIGSRIIPIYSSFISLNRGEIRPMSLTKSSKIGIIICYEDLFEENSLALTNMNAELLVNLTNDKWYGESLASYQHLMLSIPRAIENKRFLVRSTYNGISSIISPSGKLLKELGTNARGYLARKIPLIKEQSFYSKYYSKINFIYYMIFFAILLLFIKEARKK